MFKVYISADIEGVNNVVYPHQTEVSGGNSYLLSVKQQHQELNCIIEALIEAKVDKITVNDAHGAMENLHVTELNPKIELITGKPKPVSMMSNLDESYSCVFLTGYHAKAGSLNGVLAHTFSVIFNSVRLNGDLIGEIELNAIYAGLSGVPVALVTGDNFTCCEASSIINKVKTVCTKTAISTTSAICRSNEELMKDLKSTVLNIIKNPQDWTIYKKNPPYTLGLDFSNRQTADMAELLPGIKRLSSTTVKFCSDEYQEIYKLLQFLSAAFRV